ncbi:MAG TPA: prolipoprotein diacylglyceryl transferase family protein, partial [bacterium]|nr:prolipoprotein diacylglyceryl transferase family protein [bacterium]
MPSDIAFEIGPIAVRWYGILIASSMLIGTKLALDEAQRQGIDEDIFLNLILIGAPLGVLGTRIYYVIFNWGYYRHHLPEIPKLWEGGLAIHGGII